MSFVIMSRLRDFAVRLVNLFRRERLERELDAELQAYLELEVQENIRRGMAPKDASLASRVALARLGGVEMVKEQCRDVQRFRVGDDLWRDVKYALRSLSRSRGFALVAVVTVALGIGASTAVFSVVDASAVESVAVPTCRTDRDGLAIRRHCSRGARGLAWQLPRVA